MSPAATNRPTMCASVSADYRIALASTPPERYLMSPLSWLCRRGRECVGSTTQPNTDQQSRGWAPTSGAGESHNSVRRRIDYLRRTTGRCRRRVVGWGPWYARREPHPTLHARRLGRTIDFTVDGAFYRGCRP